MRALLSTIGSRGDVQPLVALALQLRSLGHDVRMCVPPDFQDWIDRRASRVGDLGIGTAHGAGTVTVESLTAVLDRTLQPDVARRAQAVGNSVRRDGAQAAADCLIGQWTQT